MSRLFFEACRLGALLIGALPFLLADPASVWLRGCAFAWMFLVTVDVAALSALWYRPEDEHEYSLFVATVVPLFCAALTWCLTATVIAHETFGGGPWDLRHALLFCLPAGYVFPFFLGAVPQALSDRRARIRFARR